MAPSASAHATASLASSKVAGAMEDCFGNWASRCAVDGVPAHTALLSYIVPLPHGARWLRTCVGRHATGPAEFPVRERMARALPCRIKLPGYLKGKHFNCNTCLYPSCL
jgi:hypothetical protein